MSILEKMTTRAIPEHYLSMDKAELERRAIAIKDYFGDRLFVPGHHYQKDEVIRFADATGDSLQLAQLAAKQTNADYIVFCGVHFMAETADILTEEHQKVLLPDLRAGCSMADMADIHQLERAWDTLQESFGDTIVPLTYVNSTAAIKAFCGEHGGATLTSSNAREILEWAFRQKKRVLFLPDQHLGRNTGVDLGIDLQDMVVWDPIYHRFEGDWDANHTKIILWKGHCSVHEKFTVEQMEALRASDPDIKIIVHPECSYEVVQQADASGSTKKIIDTIEGAAPGTHWAIGTEMNLVNRLIDQNHDKYICSLNPYMCPCLTMNRIDLPHLVWALDSIMAGSPVNTIKVDDKTTKYAKVALDRMLKG